jgi:cell division septum initiation protein DivIVA
MTTNASTPRTPASEAEPAATSSGAAGRPDSDATRTAQILRLAEAEAAAVRAQAGRDAEAVRDEAHQYADAVRAQAERDAADARLAAVAEAEAIRQQALAEAQERRAELEAEADELVMSVWWLAERVRAAAGKDPRDLPRVAEDIELADVGVGADEPGDTTTGYASEETLARHSALRRAAVAAQRSKRTTEAAQQESDRTLARARREAEELLNRARAEARHLVANAQTEGERATVLARRRVETLNRERDGVLARLAELTERTDDLGLHETVAGARPSGKDGAAP